MNRRGKTIFNITATCVIAIGLIWVCSHFVHLGHVEYTDNAQVKQHIVPVNSRVQGFIKEIRFEEYTHVKKGDTLVIIEDAEFRLRLAQAEAQWQNTLAAQGATDMSISATENNLHVSDAGIEEMKVLLENAKREYIRYEKLLEQDAVTKQQYDAIRTNYEATKAKYKMMVRQKQSTAFAKEEQTRRMDQDIAASKAADAARYLAALNLSYTVITAPFDGYTGRKTIQEGELIQPGQTMVDMVEDNSKWVIANYKETQTAHIEIGMPVKIEVDAIPGVTFDGEVECLSPATGASFSLMPQDNSAGNFVKIEQRIPVRIKFTDANSREHMLRLKAGMNAECEVKYKQK